MPEINKHIALPRNAQSGDDLDFSYLRKKGIEYIEQLSGALWSDYNSHDPGITILEMLAYAITDLSARIEMPMEDLLSLSQNESLPFEKQFFTAPQILTSSPVTENDYRKLFIDIKGVKNCWVMQFQKAVHVDHKNNHLSYNPTSFIDIDPAFKTEFQLQGLYSIIVDLEEINNDEFPDSASVSSEKERIFNEIKNTYHDNRNLCEDLVEISEVSTCPIKVCAQIEVAPDANEEWVHAQVLLAIDNYFSPSITFYTLQEMIDKGYNALQIFDGPVLNNGFIDPEELKNASLRSEVRLSDIMLLIMNIEGVKVIRDISISAGSRIEDGNSPWVIHIAKGKKPVRCTKSAFSYYKGELPITVNAAKVHDYINQMKETKQKSREMERNDMEPSLPLPSNKYTSETTTIQNDFPETYGIGQSGLPPHTDKRRKALALQLKGYLLFFDQLMASYFAHLEEVKTMLAVKDRKRNTYFTRAVKDVKELSTLVNEYPVDNDEELSDILFSKFDHHVDRNNRVLDHLIARFAETFSDYAFLMKQLYGSRSDEMVLRTKEKFLETYSSTSMNRGTGFNYFNQPDENLWNTMNVSGIEKRIATLMGMNYERRSLSKGPVELYTFNDSNGIQVYRWRIRDLNNKIVLTATENYLSTRQAEEELAKSILKVIETNTKSIEELFSNEAIQIKDETIVGNLQIQLSERGKYSFNVIDRDADPESAKWVIARHYIYYGSKETLKKAMLDFVNFITYQFSEEGMFVVEHILLRPDVTSSTIPLQHFMPICINDSDDCQPVDPYSYRVTVILPGWTHRFSNIDFREYLENRIREELPAHILARVCWVGYRENYPTTNENDMEEFEEAYREFLFSKTGIGQAQDEEKLIRLIKKMSRLNNIYPHGRLMDCDDEEEELKGRIVLGRTNIGNI